MQKLKKKKGQELVQRLPEHLTQIKEETWVLGKQFFWRELLLCQDLLHTQWGEKER